MLVVRRVAVDKKRCCGSVVEKEEATGRAGNKPMVAKTEKLEKRLCRHPKTGEQNVTQKNPNTRGSEVIGVWKTAARDCREEPKIASPETAVCKMGGDHNAERE